MGMAANVNKHNSSLKKMQVFEPLDNYFLDSDN